ncbi:hypothetical protein O181_025941 [Austropuccinia psidii MF-1]|uniref:Uncharacterized protein n=1 Tax=Austropuccinia psidii MF-1 TaxID=1389203 RepID=A0A9Q3CJJ9_9BASI|nr:hypothetical protein [Austropuccinia psidii MF-1]
MTENYSLICFSVVGVEFKIQQEEHQQRARINKRTFQVRNHKITRLISQNNLPSLASTESVHLGKFIYFLMGMPPSVDDFPPNPTQDGEAFHIHWVNIFAKQMKAHLETFEYGLRDHPISESKILVKKDIASISQRLQPPDVQPSHDILNNKIKVSIIEKCACGKECKLVGFKRITFQWGSSFNNSTCVSLRGILIYPKDHK